MFTSNSVYRIMVLCFMVLVGIAAAKGIQSGSTLALILSGISLAAGACCMYLLSQVEKHTRGNN